MTLALEQCFPLKSKKKYKFFPYLLFIKNLLAIIFSLLSLYCIFSFIFVCIVIKSRHTATNNVFLTMKYVKKDTKHICHVSNIFKYLIKIRFSSFLLLSDFKHTKKYTWDVILFISLWMFDSSVFQFKISSKCTNMCFGSISLS